MAAPLTIEELYDSEQGKIVIPAGMKRFAAIAYKGIFPVLYVKVAGVTNFAHNINEVFYTHRENVPLEYCVKMKREPENRYDENAIAIWAGFNQEVLFSHGSENGYVKIGYIPKELAALLTQVWAVYKIWYKVKLDTITPEIKQKAVPPSCRITLTPPIKERIEAPPAPRMRTLKISPDISIRAIQKKLSRKG